MVYVLRGARDQKLRVLNQNTRTGGYTEEHDNAHLVMGDMIELLARCAEEYFKRSTVVKTLHERLKLVIEHVRQTCTQTGILPVLKEPRQSSMTSASPPSSKKNRRNSVAKVK